MIQVEREQLEATATQFDQVGDSFENDINKAANLCETLCEEWKGNASQAFKDQFNSLKDKLNATVTLMHDISAQVKSVASAFSEGDDNIAGQIRNNINQ